MWVGLASSPPRAWVVVLPVLGIGLVGYVTAEGDRQRCLPRSSSMLLAASAGIAPPRPSDIRFAAHRALAWNGSRVDPCRFTVRQVSRLKYLVKETRPTKTTNPSFQSARVLLQQAVALTRKDVYELMTPRSSMVSLPSTVGSPQAAATFRATGLSRVPIFGESRDDIVGILYAKDLFAQMTDARIASKVAPAELARPAVFVPESKNAYDLLEELRREQAPFCRRS